MAERSTVEGAVQSLIFQNEDNGYTVLSLLTDDGELVTVVGCIPCAAPGEGMTVTGVWTNHPSYGPQFAAESVERRMPDGEATFRKISMPAWIAPKAVGQTPMYEALLQIRDLTQAWCTNPAHSESFPPIVFNITDGEASDCDQREQLAICEKIRTIGTTDGKVLLINIHIATTSDSRSLLFPTEEEIPTDNRYARLLHDCSSPMPEELSEAIRQVRGDLAMPPFRGMSYNTSIAELIAILNIGSISIKIQ